MVHNKSMTAPKSVGTMDIFLTASIYILTNGNYTKGLKSKTHKKFPSLIYVRITPWGFETTIF